MDKKQKLAIVVIVVVTALLSGVVLMKGGRNLLVRVALNQPKDTRKKGT